MGEEGLVTVVFRKDRKVSLSTHPSPHPHISCTEITLAEIPPWKYQSQALKSSVVKSSIKMFAALQEAP